VGSIALMSIMPLCNAPVATAFVKVANQFFRLELGLKRLANDKPAGL